ncbi:MAG: cupin domain-containing protein [Cellvibrionaceae bacterium]
MKTKPLIGMLLIIVTAPTFAGNKQAPEKTHGISAETLQSNALGPQINAMQGYDFRSRRVTIEPGGATNEHSHAERPGIVYVEQGKIIEYRNGTKKTYKPGDTWVEKADTVHWVYNKTKKPVVLIITDIIKQ